jgi:hypothetical protein
MARETCYVYDISKSREHQRVVDGANEFNMTKMTWTIILGQTTGCTTASNKIKIKINGWQRTQAKTLIENNNKK